MHPPDLARALKRLEPSGWLTAARGFAATLRSAGHEPGRLLVVGTPDDEPWHLTAHLADVARWRAVPSLQPVLVRRVVPPGAPAHLATGLDAVHTAGRESTVLVATPSAADDPLLERLADARHGGARVLALHPGAGDLQALAHDELLLPSLPGLTVPAGFELATHAVTEVAATAPRPRRPWQLRSRA